MMLNKVTTIPIVTSRQTHKFPFPYRIRDIDREDYKRDGGFDYPFRNLMSTVTRVAKRPTLGTDGAYNLASIDRYLCIHRRLRAGQLHDR